MEAQGKSEIAAAFNGGLPIIMLAGVYYGSSYGGSTASILLNLPGSPSSAVTCIDGYPMSQQGRAGVALFMTTVASFIGGTIGILLLMVLSPAIASIALNFGSAEYFALLILGLVAAATISSGSTAKSIGMIVLGAIIGLIGTDINTGTQRFTFGLPQMFDGIGIVVVAMGLFGVAEIISGIRTVGRGQTAGQKITFRSMVPTRDDIRRSIAPILRGTGVGSVLGALPGTGAVIAAFMAYAVERKVARDPSRFGNGAIEGVVCPEAANNAADQTNFIPTLTLGIPGSVVMALMIGALMIHGIAPSPLLMTEHPELFWGLVMSFWIGNLLLLVINIPLIGVWVRLVAIPYHLLYPAILIFICLGVYSVNSSVFDIMLVVVFGAFGYAMRQLGFPPAPLLLGLVLGPMIEQHLKRALLFSRGEFTFLIESPITSVCFLAAGILLLWSIVGPLWKQFKLRSISV